ncbi:aminotransferase class I/II-fold pyridoxal phosphate-dependent enzyme [Lacibacterium aquatile]|uniref:Aminotransferase class I/II-fold pyridoxal phosphate-dependent enzyme n=1 Tax=Lacibacterium aquatile TaxID=1168082 RepID=A0ABW5DTY8_9PROT
MSILDKFAPLQAAYSSLKEQGFDPFGISFDSITSATEGVFQGRSILLMGTNNYLGLTFDPACIDRAVDALTRYGTGTTGSRIANGTYVQHSALEAALADFYGRDHAMVFSTGYQANLGILSTLVGKDDHLIIDADSHASIYDGVRLGNAQVLRFRHNDPNDLYKRLKRLEGVPGDRLIVVEGIYSMLGDKAPLAEIAAIKREMGAYLLVDEAHSLGVLGEGGRGLAEEVGVDADVDFIVGTFSKSLGTVGGFCVSNIPDFDVLRVACRPYMFTASLPPSSIASSLEALNQLRQRPALRQRLRDNSEHLHAGLRALGFQVGPTVSPIVSIALPDQATAIAFWNKLLAAGIYLNLSLPPATPNNLCLLRSSISAAHTPAQIDRAIDIIETVGLELGVISPSERPVLVNSAL